MSDDQPKSHVVTDLERSRNDPRKALLRAIEDPDRGAPPRTSETARKRVERVMSFSRTGATLVTRLRDATEKGSHRVAVPSGSGLSKALMLAGVGALLSVFALLFTKDVLVIGGLAALLSTIGLLVGLKLAPSNSGDSSDEDLALADRFDKFINSVEELLPSEAILSLERIKGRLGHLMPVAPEAVSLGVLSTEDSFYLRETCNRYVPDTIFPFVALSDEARERAGPESPSALLIEQLRLIELKLRAIGKVIEDARTRQLKQNKDFLQRKVEK